jgi:hypothetical protein
MTKGLQVTEGVFETGITVPSTKCENYVIGKQCHYNQYQSTGQPHKRLLHDTLITNSKMNLKYGLMAHFNKRYLIITQTRHSENDISLHGIEYRI